MEAHTMAYIHKAHISREDEAESSSVEGPRFDQNSIETGTSKAAGSSKLGAFFPLGARRSRERPHRGWRGGPRLFWSFDFDTEHTGSFGAKPRSVYKVSSF
ncbi:unnamed protein product [Arabis nemorensis]|uniref:Uncharacterized protein n=1 Tax=Arabis nemorensis TaxID=586526 RepID=A0A565AWC8_9BRAS|nr:unnamed protein product [Arabis nemorensis]